MVDQIRNRARLTIQARRGELGYASQEALADAAGVGLSTVGRLERGQRVSAVKEADVERALRWAVGSIDALFAGDDVTLLVDLPTPESPVPTGLTADERRITRYLHNVRGWEPERIADFLDELRKSEEETRPAVDQ